MQLVKNLLFNIMEVFYSKLQNVLLGKDITQSFRVHWKSIEDKGIKWDDNS